MFLAYLHHFFIQSILHIAEPGVSRCNKSMWQMQVFFPFYFLSILACQWNANCAFRKCTEIKQHRNLLSFFSWSHNCLFFMTTLWIYGRLLAFAIMTMLTVCYCVGSPARQCLTNFDTLYLLKQLFCMENGFTGYCSIECCKAHNSVRLSKVNIHLRA